MTLMAFLTLLTRGLPSLTALLDAAAAANPDLQPKVDEWKVALSNVPTPENLAQIGAAIPGELLNIAQGKINPRDNPSNAI